MEPSHTKPNTKRRDHMSAKAVSGGSEPWWLPGGGKGRHSPGRRESIRQSHPSQEPSWDQPGQQAGSREHQHPALARFCFSPQC